jgi:hypothetical protein
MLPGQRFRASCHEKEQNECRARGMQKHGPPALAALFLRNREFKL